VNVHPATLLLAWGGLVVVLQSLSTQHLALLAVPLVPLSTLLAGKKTRLLLLRARWLLLSLTLLFVLATPGERVPGVVGDIGVTFDGLKMAAEHVLRLVLLLVTLAVLHEHLGNGGFVAGCHWLLTPLSAWREFRERIVVRLLLVLEYVETSPGGGWRRWLTADTSGPDRLTLVVQPARVIDWVLLALLAAGGIWFGWPSSW
jgi:hypothetical protein